MVQCFLYSKCQTLGRSLRGENIGSPVIGNNVFIGPHSIIIGDLKIGNNCAIGPGSIVTSDISDNAVVVGNPAKIVSYNGSEG